MFTSSPVLLQGGGHCVGTEWHLIQQVLESPWNVGRAANVPISQSGLEREVKAFSDMQREQNKER